jgi:hypothetical protein
MVRSLGTPEFSLVDNLGTAYGVCINGGVLRFESWVDQLPPGDEDVQGLIAHELAHAVDWANTAVEQKFRGVVTNRLEEEEERSENTARELTSAWGFVQPFASEDAAERAYVLRGR